MSDSPFTISKQDAEILATRVQHGDRLTFENQANRNWVAKICRQRRVNVHKSSIRNQAVDPRYIVETSHLPDKGLGNSRQFYGSLYKLEREDRW